VSLHVRFWREEIPLRLRSWWRRRWWPARVRQLDRERRDWKRWCEEAEHERDRLRAALGESEIRP
jgi:hypothetical protein